MRFVRFRAGAVLFAGALVAVLPLRAMAHGDLFLRLHDLTVRIQEAGTNSALLYVERGELKREHGDFDGARQDYEEAAKLAPNLAKVDLCRGRLLADTGKAQEALAKFDRVVQMPDADPAVFIDRARVKLDLGNRASAIEDFRKGLELASEPNAEVYLELAQTLAAEHRVPEALTSLGQGVKKCGPQTSLHAYAMDLELERGNTNAAIQQIDGIIASSMRAEKWWALRGDLLASSGDSGEALRSYKEAIKAIQKLPPRLQQTPHTTALRQKTEASIMKFNQPQ